ncbi:uncharacterized protein LOC107983708 isoform X3 [Anolis carolinensis]|uniref:uncharacterized protein LOC107983708 isoform X3 n=1 Tax=Anolis carolinensis TaxID=28377 RepID=UPI002F2B41C9
MAVHGGTAKERAGEDSARRRMTSGREADSHWRTLGVGKKRKEERLSLSRAPFDGREAPPLSGHRARGCHVEPGRKSTEEGGVFLERLRTRGAFSCQSERGRERKEEAEEEEEEEEGIYTPPFSPRRGLRAAYRTRIRQTFSA